MRLAVSLLALVAAVPALAEDLNVQAPVAAVTVYPDGAKMTRRASFDLPAGETRVFLPYEGLDYLDALPRILASDGVSVGALGFRRDVPVAEGAMLSPAQTAARDEIERLEDEIAAAEDARATQAAAVKSLEARLSFLAKAVPGEAATAESLLAMAGVIADEVASAEAALVAARAALRPLDEGLAELADALAAAEAAFERLSPPGATTDMLSVELSVAEAGPVTLELSQLTRQAWWQMDYDIDLDRAARSLEIDRKLIVMQETGEIWGDVELTLSTARPGESVAPAPVYPDQARIDNPAEYARAAGDAISMSEAAPVIEPEVMIETAKMQIDGLALSYIYPTPVTIASDEAAELALDELSVAAEPMVWASPQRDETAFTVARFTNTTGEPLLPGPANILRDGHLVGRNHIEMIPAGAETEMGFGPIDGIRLKTIFETNAEGDTGLISRSNTREQKITFTVENLTTEPQQVRAFYPLTYSEQEDLRVRVDAVPPPDETDIERERGVSAWDLALGAGETAEVNLTVRLDWPEGMELSWFPH
ncbi:MAG: DUF4139 domain-containing protein [Maritimibacter sp.]|nr:DUF4139 domain-containing protein [Maritimibacter sp.]